ncbi:AIPR family protein [Alistipes shahii]|uniref:AIPR family protein n=1 Tax=Alistipes shahii TaxID=328814 RepID=UPI0035226C96
MDIGEFRIQFMEQLRFDAEHEGTEPESQFISKALDLLEEIGDVSDPMPMSIEMKGGRGRIMAFDAYAYDEADGALIMIASDFINEIDNTPTLTNTRIDELFLHMRNFIEESVEGDVSAYCDDSDPAINIAKEIKTKVGKSMLATEILRFKFIILSNAVLSRQVKNVSREEFLERPVELNIWTIERFHQTYSTNSSEIIEIETKDFGCDGIQYLKADIGEDANYDAYLGIVPGEFLANIYCKYGSKLLQGNIRAFLSVRGKVNKGIRETIIKNPENFFTYNNGIAVVARTIGFSEDKSKIIYLKDPQIINGGQTTASLANAKIKKEVKDGGMNNLFVPMKLTVLNVDDDMSEEDIDRYNSITKTISQCANSQNAVSEADFFSNHPFHVLMEQLSRKKMAPPVNGNPYQTIWFYERSRGKWEQEQMQLSPAARSKFCEKHPKNQVIKKEKLAKCLNAFAMNPHEVCQSSAINFSHFAKTINNLYETSKESINEVFFSKCVCSVIIFDSLDRRINKADWYPTGGNKAQIIPYAIAKMMSMIPKDLDLDWKLIWQKQEMYPALEKELMNLAHIIHEFFEKEAQGGLVRSLARRADTWNKCKNLPLSLSEEFRSTLIPKYEMKQEEAAAKKERKFSQAIDISVEVFKLGAEYWKRVYNDLSKENILSYGDVAFIGSITEYIKRNSLPSAAQCKRLIKIVEKAEDKGYIMP